VHTEMGDLKPRCHPAWDNGVLAIRPERIVVHRDRPGANAVRAVVSEVFYRGDRLDIYVQPLNLHLRSVPGAANLKPGQEIWLELPTRHLEALGE
jgi:spermidine/putrescine transport system ATP-binding protein